MKIKFGKRKVDLAPAFPLTLGDLRSLGKSGLLTDTGDLNLAGADGIIGLLTYVANKSLPDGEDAIEETDVETLSLTELPAITAFFTEAMGGEKADRPT
tara:strand:- start:1622 stop:1918 length:297 start_codon:yes stop_codon:yes gene_type:complete